MAKLESIPVGTCILWDGAGTPGAGWSEVILNGRFVRIGAGLGYGGSATQSHTHSVSASSGQETYSNITGESYSGSTVNIAIIGKKNVKVQKY